MVFGGKNPSQISFKMLNFEHIPKAKFSLPEEATQFDVAPDGRIIAAGIDSVWRESEPGSRKFLAVKAPNFGNPAMIKVSPSGTFLAVGSYENSSVRIFDLPSAGKTTDFSVRISPYDAEWYTEEYLAVTGQGEDGIAPPSAVHIIDTKSKSAILVIKGIPGHSGGVTFDIDGNLYTGIGSASDGGATTGLIKAFSNWRGALSGGPLDFQNDGKECVDILSAATLSFDRDNNLCIGGGGGMDSAGDPDMGYVGVVSHHGLRGALHDQPVVDPTAAPHVFQRLDPTKKKETYWLTHANPIRGEIYVFGYGEAEVHVFRPRLIRRVIETHFQLGDNPGYYKGTRYVGMKLQMALRIPDASLVNGGITIRLGTQYVQTLGVSRHLVSLNGNKIGEITDGSFVEERETFDFFIDQSRYQSIAAIGNPAELTIEVDTSPGPGMADDFVLRYVGTIHRQS